MGLADKFEKLATKLFDTFEDFRSTVSIVTDVGAGVAFVPGSDYNPAGPALVSTGLAFARDYEQRELNSIVLAGDVLYTLKYDTVNADIPPNSRILDGINEYHVVSFEPVPKVNPIIIKCHCRGIEGE